MSQEIQFLIKEFKGHPLRKTFRKTNISNPLIRTQTCACQGARNVSFSENFAYVLNGSPLSEVLDRNSTVGGKMLFVREDIHYKLLSIEKNSIEAFYVEINLRKIKWLLWCSYNPNQNSIHAHLENLDKNLALYSSSYENHIMCDFDVGP